MQFKTIGELMRGRMAYLQIGTLHKLKDILFQRGIDVAYQTISLWHTDVRRPSRVHLEGLLDVLAIYDPDQRARAHRLGEPGANPVVVPDSVHA